MATKSKKLTVINRRVNEMTQAEFARYKGVSKPMVTRWKQEGRLIMTADGKRILVNESNQRLKDTASPAGYTNSIHAAARKNKSPESDQEIPFTELKKQIKESQLDLETHNADDLFKNSRALKEKAAALQAAAEHEKFIGSLVARSVVEKILFERSRQFRDGITAVSKRLAPMIVNKESIKEIELEIDNELIRMLDDFAKLPVIE